MEPTNSGTGEQRLRYMNEAAYPGGVVVDPTPITAGEDVIVFYNGPLSNSGADQIFLHLGYGDMDAWCGTQDLRMAKTGFGWVKTIEVPMSKERLNFCFKDSVGNWDNNNNLNWTWVIHQGRRV